MSITYSFRCVSHPRWGWTPWVSALEQESYFPYIKRVTKRHCKLSIHFTFKISLQNLRFNSPKLHAKTLDVLIGEKTITLWSPFMDVI